MTRALPMAAAALAATVIVAATPVVPRAQPAPAPTPAPAAPTPPAAQGLGRIAFAPLTALTEGSSVAPLEAALAAAAARLPGAEVVDAATVRQTLRKAKRRDLESCEGDAACLADLGALLGARVVLSGDASALAADQVVYLRALDVASRQELGSTTVVFKGDEAQRARDARAALVRVLLPDQYRGGLAVTVDVDGATVFLDGKLAGKSTARGAPIARITATVGTHAVRVTHPKYRDFVQFIEVPFDATTNLQVDLTPYPVVTDDMRQAPLTATPRRTGPVEPRPWYREWWAVAGFGVLVVATTATVVYLATPGVEADDSIVVGK